nr:McfJ [Coleophoma empetri]
MHFSHSPGSGDTQNDDSIEMVETLCMEFRDRLLVVLSSACQSDFTEAKKIAEQRLRDILDTTSSLFPANITYHAATTGRSLCSSNATDKSVSTPGTEVMFDQPMLDCTSSTPSVAGSAVPTHYQDFGASDQMAVEDPALVNLFAAETHDTGYVSGSCLQDSPFGVGAMNSSALTSWSPRNQNFPGAQEHDSQLPDYLSLFEGEPNFDDWVSNMTWCGSESQSSPSDGHLADDTIQFNHMHLDQNSQVARNLTSAPSPNTSSTSTPLSDNSSPRVSPSPSSRSSAFDSCSGIQEVASAKCVQRTPRKPRRTTDPTFRNQQIRSRVSAPTSQLAASRSENIDREEARIRKCMSPARHVRRADNEVNTIPPDLSVEYALGRFSNAEEVFETFRQRLSEDRRHLSSLLMRLFYAVGSPDALRQLRDALDLARKNYIIPAYHAANDLATTVSMLDQLDATTTLSHILRRYHLVRLLDHRSKLESSLKAAKLASKGTKRRLKYDCAKIEIMKRGAEAAFDADAKSAKDNQLKYRSKTQALSDLMRTLYPDLQPDPEGSSSATGCEYNRKLTKLRNRLSCARNWYQFEQEFPGAILALIPCAAGDLSISIDHVEKLPSDVLRIFLDYLKEKRGAFLHKMSQALSNDLYDILTRRNVTQKYKLEQTDENSLGDFLYDSDELLELCRTT